MLTNLTCYPQHFSSFALQAPADGAGEAQARVSEELRGERGGREGGHEGPGESQHPAGGRGEAGEGGHRAVHQGHALQGGREL